MKCIIESMSGEEWIAVSADGDNRWTTVREHASEYDDIVAPPPRVLKTYGDAAAVNLEWQVVGDGFKTGHYYILLEDGDTAIGGQPYGRVVFLGGE